MIEQKEMPKHLKQFQRWQEEVETLKSEQFSLLRAALKIPPDGIKIEETPEWKAYEDMVKKNSPTLNKYDEFEKFALQVEMQVWNSGVVATVKLDKKCRTEDAPNPYYSPHVGGSSRFFGTWQVTDYLLSVRATAETQQEFRMMSTVLESIKNSLKNTPSEKKDRQYKKTMSVKFEVFEPVYEKWEKI